MNLFEKMKEKFNVVIILTTFDLNSVTRVKSH